VGVKHSKGDYLGNAESPNKLSKSEIMARGGYTVLEVEKDYAAIESFELGLEVAKGKVDSEGGEMKYYRIMPFGEYKRKTSEREGYIKGSITWEADNYQKSGREVNGDILIIDLSGGANWPIYRVW
ncbi:hypothetical protein KJ780_04630, partial [Candidatus Micrarchaeota archaeon]|nr:hypothetical protein [Candidatus Micrarchaeota archaeon]